MRRAIAKFGDPTAEVFLCPVCSGRLTLQGAALVCASHHVFDVSRHGYVDLRRHRMSSTHYTDSFFAARRWAMGEKGIYSDAISVIADFAARFGGPRMADIGCGDGFITRAVGCAIGLDISLDAIKTAARGGGEILWVCGDGAHVPVATGCLDGLLNVFAPADYAQFSRIAPGGVLIKVIPGTQHMRQLRTAVGLPAQTDSSARDLLQTHSLTILAQQEVTQTTRLASDQEAQMVAAMSPVAFARDTSAVTHTTVPAITTDCVVVAARLSAVESLE